MSFSVSPRLNTTGDNKRRRLIKSISQNELMSSSYRESESRRPRRKQSDETFNKSSLNATYGGYDSNEGDNIKVFVRIRPPHKQIAEGGDNSVCLEVNSPKSLTIFTKPEPKQFSYDHVANMETTQEEVFATVGKGIMEAFINGFNGTIFAYGQTGSGKTFTMLGPPDDGDNFSHELRGVIPRGFEYIFSLLNRQQEKSGDRVEFLARCSFLEIYNEQVFDLLEPSTACLNLRENIKKGVFVEGLAERDVTSAKDAYSVLQAGWMNRRVASTSMNRESSRSHAVFTVSLESKKRSGGMNNIKISKLHLVDLAGSERQKDTNTEDVRLKEAGSINKSLSALGNVIMALVDIAHGKTRHVHYRDSKLTFILRDSLGGNAKTFIIANVHPLSRCFGETLSTLNFARRAKMIKNKAVMNEDVTGNVKELQSEIRRLKELLSQSKAGIPEHPKTDSSECVPTGATVGLSTSSSVNESESGSHWKEMMLNAIGEREQTEQQKLALQEKVQKLEELCSKKEKFLQSTRMILKFRTEHIAKLERTIKKTAAGAPVEEDGGKDKEMKCLKEEIKLLQQSIDHHPEVKRFAIENLELRAEIKRLKASDPSNGDFTKNMAEKHRYTLQLERQLRELMTSQSNDLEKSLSSSQQSLEASNAEVERMKMEVAHVQAKNDTLQNELRGSRENLQQRNEELVQEREIVRKKEMDFSANEAALRKINNELERQLESLRLSTAMERQSMSSLHIQTIKTLSTPKKFGTPRSTPVKKQTHNVSTPIKKLNLSSAATTTPNQHPQNGSVENKENVINGSLNGSYVNDPDRPLDQEPPPKYILQRKDSLNDMTDSEDEDLNVFDESYLHQSSDKSVDAEAVYIDALQNEVKQLQDWYNDALKKYYNEQSKQIPLLENIAKLDHKVKELDNLFIKEREEWTDKESQLNSQLTIVRDKYKETHGSATILKSEVDDLKILLKSADKQLDGMKKEKNEVNIEATRKYAALESKYVKLEIEYFNLQTENDEMAEQNNNLQVDYEQRKEECEYYRHKTCELDEQLEQEKKLKQEAHAQNQLALEKLSYEYETKIQYSQDTKEETLNKLLEKNDTMSKELEEKHAQITSFKNDIESARKESAAQKWLHVKDGQVINNFMKKVEDLNVCLGEKANVISGLNSELEDVKEQQTLLQKHYEEKKNKIHKLQDALKVESEKLAKEKTDRETEVTSLQEEILIAQDQFKELTRTLTENSEQLKQLQADHLEAKVSLADKMNKITILEETLSSNNHSAIFEVGVDETNILNESIDKLNALSERYEVSQAAREQEIDVLKRRCSEYEIIESGNELLEQRLQVLEMEVDELNKEKKEIEEREEALGGKICQLENEKHHQEESFNGLITKQKSAESKNFELQQELALIKMNFCNVQEDLDYNLEELEKTKTLEEKYFSEANEYRSKLEMAEEEKRRFSQQIQLLEDEKAKQAGHQNHDQKIEYLLTLKKNLNQLTEEVAVLRKKQTKCICK